MDKVQSRNQGTLKFADTEGHLHLPRDTGRSGVLLRSRDTDILGNTDGKFHLLKENRRIGVSLVMRAYAFPFRLTLKKKLGVVTAMRQ